MNFGISASLGAYGAFSPAIAKHNLGFSEPNLNLGTEASFRVTGVEDGKATTGGAIVILLLKLKVGKLGETFGCCGGLVEKDGTIDGVGGSAVVVEDAVTGKVKPGLAIEENVVLIPGFSTAIDGNIGFL